MRKKDLMEFLDKVESKAIKSVNDNFSKLIEDEKNKLLIEKGYQGRIEEIQKKVNKLHAEAQNLVLDMTEDISIRLDDWNNLAHKLSDFTGSNTLLRRSLNKSNFDGGSVELIRAEKDKEISEVKANYSKVRVVCNNMTQATRIAMYLKGLGFDLTSLEKEESTALMCEIDKNKLFVCGDNK